MKKEDIIDGLGALFTFALPFVLLIAIKCFV